MNARRSVSAALGAAMLLFAPAAQCDDFSDNFSPGLPASAADALARDVGSLVGASSFHHGKALGFPLGVDLGVHASVAGVSDENVLLRDNGSSARALWIQAEYGLPGRTNIVGRVGELEDADLLGGGLRWGLLTSNGPGLPSISLSALYNRVRHDVFEGSVISGNIAASFEVPFVHPYLGVGYDRTRLDLDGTAADGRKGGYRIEAGVNLSIVPFSYLTIGGGLANGERLAHLGAGLRI